MTRRAVIRGIGAFLPENVVTNHDLSAKVETTHEWIVERTGIEQRHIAAQGQVTSDLAIPAAKEALTHAGLLPDDIDLIIVATTTPDDTMPSTAVKVQHGLGMTRGAAFDMNAACSGFVYGMTVANSFIQSGAAERVLLIGAETYSRILDWNDRGTCILFGDGAAALVLEAQDGERGVLFSKVHSDGQFAPLLGTSGGVSSTMTAGKLFMSGKDIFRHAVAKMPAAVEEGLAALGMTTADIDWLIPHQANQRILSGVGQKLEVPESKVVSTVRRHANTSAASIPLGMYEAHKAGKLKPGQLVVCPALGAGLTWGCTILRW